VAERRTVPRDVSEETGCRRSVMYVGALPMMVRWPDQDAQLELYTRFNWQPMQLNRRC